jgi:hypothetical protein
MTSVPFGFVKSFGSMIVYYYELSAFMRYHSIDELSQVPSCILDRYGDNR